MSKLSLPVYHATDSLVDFCRSLKQKKISIYAKFLDRETKFSNCNAVGDIFESLLFPFLKETLPDFEKGPKQNSPDFFADNKQFEFELKTFLDLAIFDICNFTTICIRTFCIFASYSYISTCITESLRNENA
jgi:hypothetical protein